MYDHRSRPIAGSFVWLSLGVTLILGSLVAAIDEVWAPAFAAVRADVILSPQELRDPKLLQVVYRTQMYRTPGQMAQMWPFRFLGGMIATASLLGMFAFGKHLAQRNAKAPVFFHDRGATDPRASN